MNFSKIQSDKIFTLMFKYRNDDTFKNEIQSKYDSDPSRLSMLEIYVLEEILRYGNKGIYDKFKNAFGIFGEERSLELFDHFIYLLKVHENFRNFKIKQLKEEPEILSELEKFAFEFINLNTLETINVKEEETTTEEYTPILFETDDQIRETLENLLLGEYIHKMLRLPFMSSVRARCKDGLIASEDKEFVIENIKSVFTEEMVEKFKDIVDRRFFKVKLELLYGLKEEVFKPYEKYKTNISYREIVKTKSI